MTQTVEHTGFLIEEGIMPPEFGPTPFSDFTCKSGNFDPEKQYAGWIGVKEGESYRAKQLSLIEAMLDFIPFEYLHRVKFICHPIGTSGTGFLDDESITGSFGWKYIPNNTRPFINQARKYEKVKDEV